MAPGSAIARLAICRRLGGRRQRSTRALRTLEAGWWLSGPRRRSSRSPIAASSGNRYGQPPLRLLSLRAASAFAKAVMNAAGVPTAGQRDLTDEAAALEYLSRGEVPIVIKADGLAAVKV